MLGILFNFLKCIFLKFQRRQCDCAGRSKFRSAQTHSLRSRLNLAWAKSYTKPTSTKKVPGFAIRFSGWEFSNNLSHSLLTLINGLFIIQIPRGERRTITAQRMHAFYVRILPAVQLHAWHRILVCNICDRMNIE